MSRFEKTIAAAVAAERALRKQEAHVASGLTAKTYVRESELQAGIDVKAGDDGKLEALAEALQKPGHDRAAAALRDMVRAIAGQGQFRFSRPSKRLGHLIDEAGLAELASCGASALELFALAARRVAAEHPSVFGEVEDMPAAEQKLAELKASLEERIAAIETAWGADDIEVAKDGVCRFRRYPVVLTSIDLGRRLLDAALRDSAAKAE